MGRVATYFAILSMIGCTSPSPSPADDGSATSGEKCSPSTCAGCCDSGGKCRVDSTYFCGKGGEQCATCSASDGKSCVLGVCKTVCGPENCDTCCSGTLCLSKGTSSSSCGIGGARCSECPEEHVCNFATGLCGKECAGTVCNGCCDVMSFQKCFSGDSPYYCGKNGNNCVACQQGGSCVDGQCN